MRAADVRRSAARVDRAIARVEAPLVGACLIAAVLLNVALVIGRFLFNYSANSMEELSVYAVIWMVFLGTILTDRHGTHINIDLMYHFISSTAKRRLRRVADVMQALVCVLLAVLTLNTVIFTYKIGEVSLSTLQAPVWILMAVMPLCFFVLAIRGIARAIGALDETAATGADAHI